MIEFKNVSKTFQSSWPALKEISFTIDRGEFAFIIGPSGSGKSTVLRMILMDQFPDDGTVRVAEYNSDSIRRSEIPKLRRKLGVIFQDFKLLTDRTVYENVAFALEVTGAPTDLIHKKSMAALNEVGLSHKRHCLPFQLSGGEQQKASIARALVNDPFLLLADEPTGNVDPAGTLEILQLLRDINAKGTAILMATHEQELVKKMPFRILTVEGGRLIRDTPNKLVSTRAAARSGEQLTLQ
jgi:cell division transport system ATP-binding protein